MIGQYVNTGRESRVTINPVVPGAQYRIIAWALGDGRSATPAVVEATTGEAGWSYYTVQIRTYIQYSLPEFLQVYNLYVHTYKRVVISTYYV